MNEQAQATRLTRKESWTASPVRVFISHETEESRSFVSRLVGDLESLGVSAWAAWRDIPPGGQWISAINEAFEQSTHELVLVGGTPPSKWVRREIEMGLERQMREENFDVIPVLYEEKAQLSAGLQLSQAVDLATEYASGLRRLAQRLGLEEDAVSALEARLITQWEEAFIVFKRHSEPIRRQLHALRQLVESERHNRDAREAEADAAAGTARDAHARMVELEGQAHHAAGEAELAAQASSRATAELERASTVVEELSRRLVELEASHGPILALVDQAEQVINSARRHGPLGVDRNDEVVALLEDPRQLPTSRETGEPTPSFGDFLHRHRLMDVIGEVIQRHTSANSSEREFVFARCIQALTREVPASLVLSEGWSEEDLQVLEMALVEAIDRYLRDRGSRDDVVARFDGEVGVAFVRYVTRWSRTSNGTDVRLEAPIPSLPSSSIELFDVTIMGFEPTIGVTEEKSLANAIHGLTKHRQGRSTDVNGYFESLGIVSQRRCPVVVLRAVDQETAAMAEGRLRRFGGEVSVTRSEINRDVTDVDNT